MQQQLAWRDLVPARRDGGHLPHQVRHEVEIVDAMVQVESGVVDVAREIGGRGHVLAQEAGSGPEVRRVKHVRRDAVRRRVALHEAENDGHAPRAGGVGQFLRQPCRWRGRLLDEDRQARARSRRDRSRGAAPVRPPSRPRRDRPAPAGRASPQSGRLLRRRSVVPPLRGARAATSHRAWSTTSWRVSWGSSISEACVPQPIQPIRSEVMVLSPGRVRQSRGRRRASRRDRRCWPQADRPRPSSARAIGPAERRRIRRSAGRAPARWGRHS